MNTIPQHDPTPEELAFIRNLQHFYCDHIIDGVPTGDWHVNSTPAQAVRSLRVHVADATTALRKELAEVTAAFQAECDHTWEDVDDSFDHEYGTEVIRYRQCEKCGKQAEPDDAEGPDSDDGPREREEVR